MKYLALFLFFCSLSAHSQIQAVGDTMLGTDLKIAHKLLAPVDHLLKKPGYINMINLEGVITDNNYSKKCTSGLYCYVFQMPDRVASILSSYDIHIANLANNHSMDLGVSGQSDTAASLIKNGIAPIGTNQYSEKFISMNGKDYVFIGISPHKNTISLFDTESLKKKVQMYKSDKKLVVVTAHMGAEGENANKVENKDEYFLGANRGNPVKISKELIDAGADLFLAHGPHVMRPMELYKGRLIVYSLGNFLTYGSFNLQGKSGLGGLVRVDLNDDGTFKSGQFFGFQQTKSYNQKDWAKGTALVESQESTNFLKSMTQKHQAGAFKWEADGKFLPNL